MALADHIHRLAEQHFEAVKKIRRHLHAHPELSFEEENTAAFVQQKLKELKIPFNAGIAGQGVVGFIQGKSNKVVALRGDMDALPIQEKNEVEYKSQNAGVMHACGHDVHTSCLLGAAMILSDLAKKDQLPVSVKLIFQPAEEKLPGGASLMIEEGVLENPTPEKIFGQHVFPELEVGKVGFRPGIYMASTDEIYVTVKGKGGHAAMPHQLHDPVPVAAQIILALQQVVSRIADPSLPTVLSFGKIVANGATNVIPDQVSIEGTFRTFSEEWRKEVHEQIKTIATQTAKAFGCEAEVHIEKGYPFLKNDEALTEKAKQQAIKFLGEENVVDLPIRMTGEDFAFYSHHLPACFYRLGTRNEFKGITSPVHTATFDIDEDALKIGMGMMAWLAVNG